LRSVIAAFVDENKLSSIFLLKHKHDIVLEYACKHFMLDVKQVLLKVIWEEHVAAANGTCP